MAFWAVAILILEGSADRPGDDSSAQQIAAYFEDETSSIFAAFLLWGLGTALFFWFLGSLRAAFGWAEAGITRLATIALSAGVATAVFALAVPAAEVAGAIAADNSERPLSPAAAEALWNLGVGFFVCAEVTAAVLLAGTALAALRSRVLPGWFALLSGLMAIALFVFPVGWAVLFLGFPLWVVIVSILLWRMGRAGIDTSPSVPTGP